MIDTALAPTLSLAGPQMFARYAFMPNRLTYCGGDDNLALFQYCIAGVTDHGLLQLLVQFTGAMPYLKLIAHSNLLADPFDPRVVEAYWLGNELLEGVQARALYDSLSERFGKQINPKNLELILGKAPAGAHPHHSFHVIEICPRNGWPNASTWMDNCRISWGQAVAVIGATLTVQVRPLKVIGNQLGLGDAELRQVNRQIDGRGMVDDAHAGDWISIHWNWACQILSPRQVANLEHWTQYHLTIANQTL
jgi:hypothetical protein